MIVWPEDRLDNPDLDAYQRVVLSNPEHDHLSLEHARQALEQPGSGTFAVPGSPVIHLKFPVDQHVQRYAEQIAALGL